jgi:hypothetical protein
LRLSQTWQTAQAACSSNDASTDITGFCLKVGVLMQELLQTADALDCDSASSTVNSIAQIGAGQQIAGETNGSFHCCPRFLRTDSPILK